MVNSWLAGAMALLPALLIFIAKTSDDNTNPGIYLMGGLGLVYLLLQTFTAFNSSHRAAGPTIEPSKHCISLTESGEMFLMQLYQGWCEEHDIHELAINTLRQKFRTDDSGGTPIDSPLFMGNTAQQGVMTEREFILRWHMAFALDQTRCLQTLQRFLVEAGVTGAEFEQATSANGKGRAARTVMQIFVFGAKGSGKSSFINSFVEALEPDAPSLATCSTTPYKLNSSNSYGDACHNLIHEVRIPDEDGGSLNASSNGMQLVLLREVAAADDDDRGPCQQIKALRIAKGLRACSLACVLYSAAEPDTYAYADQVHTAIKAARIPHMFIRTKLDLYLAAEMDVDRLPGEPGTECEDGIVESVSVRYKMHGTDGSDIIQLHEQVVWAGLNRQMLQCHKRAKNSQGSWLTLPRIAVFGMLVCVALYDKETSIKVQSIYHTMMGTELESHFAYETPYSVDEL